jgi:hypothetical protein
MAARHAARSGATESTRRLNPRRRVWSLPLSLAAPPLE